MKLKVFTVLGKASLHFQIQINEVDDNDNNNNDKRQLNPVIFKFRVQMCIKIFYENDYKWICNISIVVYNSYLTDMEMLHHERS